MIDIYLASPYTWLGDAVYISRKDNEARRCHEVMAAASYLMQRGYTVFSPIAYGHPMRGILSDGFDWLLFDRGFLDVCHGLWVLMIPGWEESKGIKQEIAWAEEVHKPLRWIEWIRGELWFAGPWDSGNTPIPVPGAPGYARVEANHAGS